MGWLMRKICDHTARNLYIETNNFADGTFSNRILCRLCGKEIVPEEHFETLKAILTTASTRQGGQMKYEFPPMEWEELVGYWASTNWLCTWYICKTTFKLSVWDSAIEDYTYEYDFKTLDDAKSAAEKHRQGLIEKLGGVRV